MTDIDKARAYLFQQVQSFCEATGNQCQIVQFQVTPQGGETYFEYCTSEDSVGFVANALRPKNQRVQYTSEILSGVQSTTSEQVRKIADLERHIGNAKIELQRARAQSGIAACAAMVSSGLAPPGTAPSDSLIMMVPAMEVLSGLADPRQLRLPLWGTSVACLYVYKQILLTGMWRGQPVRILEQMHLDLDLQPGEVYLCTQPWLFSSASGKGSAKPRHDHHTFKFQRQMPAAKNHVAEVTFRKARCARKKCDCTPDGGAFELVGARLTFSTRELTLYHFNKSPINATNVHPRTFHRQDGTLAVGEEDDEEGAVH